MTNEQLQGIIKFYEGDSPKEGTANAYLKQCAAELLASRERIEIDKQVTAEANKAWEGSQQLIARLTADNAALREQNNRAGWARVEDGLPEKHGRYLVVQRSCLGGVTYTSVASWGYPDATEDLYDACWYQWDDDGFDYRINAVTHWMSLPEPPEVQ
jgi:hypothetical protein